MAGAGRGGGRGGGGGGGGGGRGGRGGGGGGPDEHKGHQARSAGAKYEKKRVQREKKQKERERPGAADPNDDAGGDEGGDGAGKRTALAPDRTRNPKVQHVRSLAHARAVTRTCPNQRDLTRATHAGGGRAPLRHVHQAFAFQSGRSALRIQQRNTDREQKRLHVPLADRSLQEPPPIMIAVVGPPQVRAGAHRFFKHPVSPAAHKKHRTQHARPCGADRSARARSSDRSSSFTPSKT